MNLFETILGDGGFFYINNADFSLSSSGCEWSNLRAN